MELKARQRSRRACQVKRIAGAEPWGKNQPEVWGKSTKASVTAKERGEATWKVRPEKEAGATLHPASPALVSQLRILKLKRGRKVSGRGEWQIFIYIFT